MSSSTSNSKTLKATLDSGLVVLGEYFPGAKSAAVGYFVRSGARDEISVESGVSHFLEHMVFKGTRKRSSEDLTLQMGDIGAQANAFTSEENTVYYAGVLAEHLPTIHEILSDMLIPALVPGEFAMEKKVILEEIALYQDRPHFFLFEQSMRDYFQGHPAGNSVLGSVASVSALAVEQMRAYHDRRYSAPNMVLVASGKFDWDTLLSNATRWTADLPTEEVARLVSGYTRPALAREYKRKGINQAHVLLMAEGCSAEDPDRFALELVMLMLGDSSGSRLYWELVDKGTAESAGAESEERDGTGLLVAYAATEPQRLDSVAGTLRRLVSDPLAFNDADLSRAKVKLTSRLVMSGELPMGRLMALGLEWIYRHDLQSLREMVEAVNLVSRQDIERAAARFKFQEWSEFRLIPE